MNRRLKTASHLERMVLIEMHRHALCDGISAVTVRATADGTTWDVMDIYAPGGTVPAPCRGICAAAVEALRQDYDLLPEDQLVPDEDLRLV
ncbi:MAG: hypothetical protein QOI12_4332 [Alphaproteobacteria bacterium]|jgi:hypothetical protein|nr:hypothetical protein [Alphaproteobacteria bacterium]